MGDFSRGHRFPQSRFHNPLLFSNPSPPEISHRHCSTFPQNFVATSFPLRLRPSNDSTFPVLHLSTTSRHQPRPAHRRSTPSLEIAELIAASGVPRDFLRHTDWAPTRALLNNVEQGFGFRFSRDPFLSRIHRTVLCCVIASDTDCVVIYLILTNAAHGHEIVIEWPTRIKIIIGATKGLSNLHSQENIVHGNLTSSNVLLDEQTKAHITDFGLSRVMTTSTNTNIIATTGSLGYNAPELSKTKKPNTKTDVYSLGVIMLELLTGKPFGMICLAH
ncbi:proline-rich receptor-like protein kinase PERK9 [Vigna unguiculata]|uniref:proline-rich receptor-like protein kinase PERK9 n=1 Tax=Vigna unguiculata TaxID=3917 RepID=UPI00101602AA|nr:proline-rich receptor-like protein kinase PERK9 [Vigna unguiculata]